MAGDLQISDIQFDATWIENVAIPDLADGITVPDGFTIEPITGALRQPTQIEVVSPNDLLIQRTKRPYLALSRPGRRRNL